MGIFSGLEKLGFYNAGKLEIIKEESKKEQADGQKEEAAPFREENCLFPKSYTCPICDEKFKSLAVKTGKVRCLSHDDDLRPVYQNMEPLKYDAVVCPHCGYSALAKHFMEIRPVQAKLIRTNVQAAFKGISISEDKFSYEEALLRYKMVLLCDVLGNMSNGRKSYTCLKMAWLIRSKAQNEKDSLKPEEQKELEKDEMECLKNAYNGLRRALSTESFPISGMDEVTVTFLCAQLAYRLGELDESQQLLSSIIINRNVPRRIKDKALVLKDQIQMGKKEKNEESNS